MKEIKILTPSSLKESAYALLKAGQVSSDEFQALVRVFGLDKIDRLITEAYFEEHKEQLMHDKGKPPPGKDR